MVDLKKVNNACKRELHVVESPFLQASKIPPHTWKTTTDAWNSYHSVPLHPESRHLTTFVTPWGCYRYLVTPQGQKSAGDALNYRYDMITIDVEDYTRMVDDSCLWKVDLEAHIWHVLKFLTLTGNHGIVQNLKKFVFCKKKIDFLGFELMEDGI